MPLQVDLLGQGPRVDEPPRLQDGRRGLRPPAAAELQQEGVDEVREEVRELVIPVHVLDEKVDGAQGLRGERQGAAGLPLLAPWGAPGSRPVTHHQGVHRGQAPDVGLGGGVGPGAEP